MSGTSKPTKAATLAQVQALVAGTQKLFPNGSFKLGNVAYSTASLVQLFESLAAAIAAVNAAQASAKDAVMALRGLEAKVLPVMRDYRRFLRMTFGTAAQQLAEFGLQPERAHKPLDAEQRATVAAKIRATREARGTTSKKQKLAVKGDVTGVAITPITAPAPAPSPSAQPAPTASIAPAASSGSATK